jgi:hypothetical protein
MAPRGKDIETSKGNGEPPAHVWDLALADVLLGE